MTSGNSTFAQIERMTDGAVLRDELDYWEKIARSCAKRRQDLERHYRPLV
jgi:hypothetical protein